MPRAGAEVIAALLLALVASSSGWHDARTIVVPPVPLPAYVRLVLPQSIDGGPNSDYPDLRVVDGSGHDVPYALDVDPKAAATASVQLSDVGFVRGRFTQAIADVGTSGMPHDAIALDTSLPTFFERVEIATSDDRRTWSVVVPHALIYRVAQSDDQGTSTVDFGPSRARWIRIRVLDGARRFPISGASVPAVAPAPRLVPLSGTETIRQSGTDTVATIDFGTPNTNVYAAAFETTTPEFHRDAVLTTSGTTGDSAPSTTVTSALSRYRSGGTGPARLTIYAGNQVARRMSVSIANGNDPPLRALRMTALGYQHHVIFEAEPGASYRLLWGNPDATAPAYDLADILAHKGWSVATVVTLGVPASTAISVTNATDWAAWLQKAALPIALAVLCVVLLAVALAAMRTKPEV